MNVVILECVSGKDNNQRMVIGENPVKIAHAELQPGFPITELDPSQGFLLARVDKGMLLINAANCILPVYVNDRPVTSSPVQAGDILRLGSTVWRARYNSGAGNADAGRVAAGAGNAGAGAGLKKGFNDLIGLESLHDFSLGNIFSDVFKKHTSEEMEDQLITGTSRHTPSLAELEVGWGKPWLFARLLAGSLILSVILYYGWETFDRNIKLVPGLIFMGSFAIPISTLMFFLEMNVPRNVSIFRVMQLLFIGGVASLIVALIFFDRFGFIRTYLGASAAGIIEESAKLLVVIFLAGKSTRYPWILNGLLLGAAVGTGFAAFESAGFALKDMSEHTIEYGVDTIKIRGILAPFGHIIWTASSAAALWRVKGNRPFNWNMVKEPAFLRILIFVMLLHMIWNAPFVLMALPLVDDLKYIVLGVIGWIVCFRLMQTGIRQLNKARQELALPPVAGPETVRLNSPV